MLPVFRFSAVAAVVSRRYVPTRMQQGSCGAIWTHAGGRAVDDWVRDLMNAGSVGAKDGDDAMV